MADAADRCHVAEVGDPDVAGLGVTISLFISITLTSISVLILYFRLGLPLDRYTAIDRRIILFISRFWRCSNQPGTSELDVTDEAKRVASNNALAKLLESLGDQQLAMGISLSLAVYIRFSALEDFSAYSFQMATSTIWLCSLAHMAMLSALRDNFTEGYLKWRLIAIITLPLMLAPLLLLSGLSPFYADLTLSVRCALDKIPEGGTDVVSSIFTSTYFVIVATGGYVRRVHAMYRRTHLPRPPWGVFSIRKFALAIWFTKHASQPPELRETDRPLLHWWIIALQELRGSLFWEMLWLAFYFTFGITSLVMTWRFLPPLEQWSLSFGQIMPIALVMLTIPPAYDDYKKDFRDRLISSTMTECHTSDSQLTNQQSSLGEKRGTALDTIETEVSSEPTTSKQSHHVLPASAGETISPNRLSSPWEKLKEEPLVKYPRDRINQIEISPALVYELAYIREIGGDVELIGKLLELDRRRVLAFLVTTSLAAFLWLQFAALVLGGVGSNVPGLSIPIFIAFISLVAVAIPPIIRNVVQSIARTIVFVLWWASGHSN